MASLSYLVAVDNTEEATEVMAAARKLADATGASLASITVIRPIAHTYGQLDFGANSQYIVDLEQQAMDVAKQKLRALGAEYGIDADNTHVCRGNPAVEIRALAEALESDMIVIGTHARHGLGLLLGSTANAVLHGIGCDAMVVKIH